MSNTNYQYTLKLILKGIISPLIIDVREDDYDRLSVNLDSPYFDSGLRKFFNCSSLDGKFYSINLKKLQFVHFLWTPTQLAGDRLRYEGPTQVYLHDQKETVEAYTDSPEDIYDFFSGLESDAGDAFKGFTDIDGELMMFQLDEIVYASTSEDLYQEGMIIVSGEDDLI